jgi:RimJ/RimL family protein N-acetyltransferase
MGRPFEHLVVARAPSVLIRLKHLDDALNDFHWRRDPRIATYDGSGPFTLSFSDFLLRFEQELHFPDPSRRMYSLVTPEGEHIGNVMYYNATAERDSAEFGITVALEPYRGRGIGTQATVAFLRYLWDTHPFRRIYLHTLEWNERARRCFARSGFQEVARVVRGDSVYTRMEARREWWLMWDAEGRFAAAVASPEGASGAG